MDPAYILLLIANFAPASVFAAITWLYFDALLLRFELKSFLKCLAFALLTLTFAINFASSLFQINFPIPSFWIQSIALYLMFVSYIMDIHSKLQITTLLAIALIFFLKAHALLATQSFLVAVVILQLAYYSKHKDLIPLTTGFILMAIGEFFFYLDSRGIQNLSYAANFSYIFSSLVFFYWLWQYLVIRFTKTSGVS